MKIYLHKIISAIRAEHMAALLALFGTAALVYFSLALEWIITDFSFRNCVHFSLSLLLSYVILAYLIHEGGKIIHIYNRKLDPRNEKRKVLITGVSPVGSESIKAAKCLAQQIRDGKLDAISLAGDEGKELKSWQQNVRAILHHRDTLQRITLIPYDNMRENEKKSFCNLMRRLCKNDIEIKITYPIHYDDLEEVYQIISKAIKDIIEDGFREDDICIDATPGFKPYSISAATATFNHSVAFLYVDNDGQVLFYDVHLGILSNT